MSGKKFYLQSSLRSWRYCVIKVLATEPRSKKKEWGRGVTLDWYSGSAAKLPSPSTQYRQLRRLSSEPNHPYPPQKSNIRPLLKLYSSGGYMYYINTNEIPGELSREDLISSHVKMTCYLHMWKYHRCYGYIINRAFHTKKLLKWNGLVVHWGLYNKRNITWPPWRYEILFSCWREISYLQAAI